MADTERRSLAADAEPEVCSGKGKGDRFTVERRLKFDFIVLSRHDGEKAVAIRNSERPEPCRGPFDNVWERLGGHQRESEERGIEENG